MLGKAAHIRFFIVLPRFVVVKFSGAQGVSSLQIGRLKSGVLCDTRKHFRPYFITIMEGENIILPPGTFKCLMGTCLPFDRPADTQQGRQNPGCFS
jgi:hypothetical protein